jgi:hypothetical protein
VPAVLLPSVRAVLHLLLVAVTAAVVMTGCADEILPVDDQCLVDDSGKETAKWCLPCASNAECVIDGNPCCDDNLHWTCVHVDAVAKLPECTNGTCLKPNKPTIDRCLCLSGRCHAQ